MCNFVLAYFFFGAIQRMHKIIHQSDSYESRFSNSKGQNMRPRTRRSPDCPADSGDPRRDNQLQVEAPDIETYYKVHMLSLILGLPRL